jgi:hypothetical protein
MSRVRKLLALTMISMLCPIPAGQQAAAQEDSQKKATQEVARESEAPEGWEEDERFFLLGREGYKAVDQGLFAIVDRVSAPKDSHEEWLKQYMTDKLSKYEVLSVQGPLPLKDNNKRIVEGGYFANAVAKNKKGQKLMVTFGFLIAEEAQAWQIFWNNSDVEKNSKLVGNAFKFLAEGGRKAPLPEATKDFDKLLSSFGGKDSAKSKEPKTKASKSKDTTKPPTPEPQPQPQPFVAAAGEGARSDQLLGVVYDFGKRGRKKVWVNDMWTLIPTWSGSGVYLVFNDGWAYKHPSVAPADLDVAASRRLEPKKWVRWEDVKLTAPTSMMKPLAKGTRIGIFVQRPSTSSSSRNSIRTNWRNLLLTSDGRFETGSTTISSRQTGIDSSLGPSSNSVSSSGKDGSFSSFAGSYVAGGGMIRTQSANREPGGKGDHSGTYLIDGNTIELRYDNGSITRAVFGFDGEEAIIMGRTNYWAPKSPEKSK